jgi:predicted nucleotidyltransferase component of viral defense system
MDRTSVYYRQVQLLLQVIPFISRHDCFALKGGTAINLFVRDLPRLSVDIDLVYLPLHERKESLVIIQSVLELICDDIRKAMPDVGFIKSFLNREDTLRLTVMRSGVQIKIELSPVLRGTIFIPQLMVVTDKVENEFGYAEIAVVSHADLYAGKICAALDRQHPRDLFDVKFLLENEGLTDALRKATIVYMASHNRPIAELLRPKYKDISGIYYGEFLSMTEHAVELAELEETRQQLVELINLSLTENERRFLLSFKARNPDWSLLNLPDVEKLPALRWKQMNLVRMSPQKHQKAYQLLEKLLSTH